jgi:hypothetical protein
MLTETRQPDNCALARRMRLLNLARPGLSRPLVTD